MGTDTNKDERNSPEYLSQLLKDKKQIQAFPNVFHCLEKLLDEEITRVRAQMFHHKTNGRDTLQLPEPIGPVVTVSEKLFVPVKEHPDFNFVGRILGPRGMTAKELENYTGCKIMVRGKGSMRDKKKNEAVDLLKKTFPYRQEEQNRGKQNWEHLNEELHVLLTVEDTRNRAEIKMIKAVEEVKKLLIPAPEGEDELKKMQLMELAILNGTYRDSKLLIPAAAAQAARFFAAPITSIPGMSAGMTAATMAGLAGVSAAGQIRSPGPAGAPIILAPRLPNAISVPTTAAAQGGVINGMAPPPLMSPNTADSSPGLIYNPYEYSYPTLAPTTILEYPSTLEQTAAGAVPKVRRTLTGVRDHPYGAVRVSLP